MRFTNKVVLITAGSSGIGLACAHRLASEGAKVVNADIRKPTAEAEKTLVGLAGECKWIEADMGDVRAPDAIVEHAIALWGGVDVLINNAALVDDQDGAVTEATLEQWERQFNITVRGTVLLTKRCIPEMIKRGGGAIVNT